MEANSAGENPVPEYEGWRKNAAPFLKIQTQKNNKPDKEVNVFNAFNALDALEQRCDLLWSDKVIPNRKEGDAVSQDLGNPEETVQT